MTDAEREACRQNGLLLRTLVAERTALRQEGRIWRCLCPAHDDHDPSCVVYDDGHWHCYACDAHGSAFDFVMASDKVDFHQAGKIVADAAGLVDDKPDSPRRQPKPMAEDPSPDHRRQPGWFDQFWDERCVSLHTRELLGIHAGTHPTMGECVVFPVRFRGKLVDHKYRGWPKKDFRNDKDVAPTLYNGDAIEPGKPLYFVEGHTDVAAMVEAGYPATVSLRDGASSPLDVLALYADKLVKVPVFFLAGDGDAAGEKWREALSRRLGRHKCRVVTWPEGRKDASDTLRLAAVAEHYEAVSIESCIARAKAFPLEGIREIDDDVVDRAFAQPIPPVMKIGLSSDDVLKYPTEGKLIVVTGTPNHGKSSFMRFVASRTIEHHDRRWLCFVAEDDFDEYVRDLVVLVRGKPLREIGPDDRRAGAALLGGGRLRVMEFNDERHPPLIDTILSRARDSVLAGGTTDLLIDPWNELEHTRGDQTETDYIGRTLQRFRQFGREYGCNVWIAAHPIKPPPLKAGEKQRPANGYDVSGSSHWNNKPDLGFTVWSAAKGKVELHIWKARRLRWSTFGTKAKLEFDQSTGRYLDPVMAEDAMTEAASWTE